MSMSQFPLRPDKGTSGKPISLKVNIFPVSELRDIVAFQYDIKMDPDISVSLNRRAWKLVEEALQKTHKKCFLAYDGKKNAFGAIDIPDTQLTVQAHKELIVELPPIREQSAGSSDSGRGRGGGRGRGSDRGGRGGGRGGSSGGPRQVVVPVPRFSGPGPTEDVKVTIRKVAQINFHELLRFYHGQGPETETVLHASTALSVVLRHLPSMLYTPVGANFYTPIDRVPIAGGLEVWRGFHQSIRSMVAGHLGINIDVTSTVFRKGGISLVDYALEIFDLNAPNQLEQMTRDLNEQLKGVNCITIHRGDQKQRFKIARFSRENADQFKFEDHDGKSISVTQYFKAQYNLNLRFPKLPLALKANGKTAFPMECLMIAPSERYMKRLTGDQTTDMIRATAQKPEKRKETIQNAVNQVLKYQQNPYMESFGLKVKPEMMTVNARILPSPKLLFDRRTIAPKDGVWDLRGNKLVKPQTLLSAAFIFFVRMGNDEAAKVRTNLLKFWEAMGMVIKVYDCPVYVSDPRDYRATMIRAYNEANKKYSRPIQLMVCVIDKAKGIYENIKRLALSQQGPPIITQCLLQKNVRFPDEIKDQYACNLGLKVNIKLGGATNYVDSMPYMDRPTLIFGADVTHGAPGSNAPSIAAVVASVDKNISKYHTFLRDNGVRVEIIQDMENIVKEALAGFFKELGTYPKQVIFFRDGVASGQFAEVLDKEVNAIKRALHAMKLNIPLTFIIVQKRHHIRLFPIDGNKDRSDNCMSGTVIDTQIMHPVEFNFVLQSHAGLQGTSRPTIYHVIFDEIKMTSDKLQQLCYNLCFLAERATRTINMVAPAYRAHIAAYYARMFLETEETSESGSISGRSDTELKIRFGNVKKAVEAMMYYM